MVQVYKSPTCGCCAKWVDHVREGGISVKVTDLSDEALASLKEKHGIPRTAQLLLNTGEEGVRVVLLSRGAHFTIRG